MSAIHTHTHTHTHTHQLLWITKEQVRGLFSDLCPVFDGPALDVTQHKSSSLFITTYYNTAMLRSGCTRVSTNGKQMLSEWIVMNDKWTFTYLMNPTGPGHELSTKHIMIVFVVQNLTTWNSPKPRCQGGGYELCLVLYFLIWSSLDVATQRNVASFNQGGSHFGETGNLSALTFIYLNFPPYIDLTHWPSNLPASRTSA